MPLLNTLTSWIGEPPAHYKLEFLPWVDLAFDVREMQAIYKRPTRYYIDPDTGDDEDAGTEAAPWASLANVRAALYGEAGVGSNTWAVSGPVSETAFFFKRGTIIRDSTTTNGGAIVINNVGIEIGAYGPIVAGALTRCVEPIISGFTIQWKTGATLGDPTSGATARRTLSLTNNGTTMLNPGGSTRIGWIRWARSCNNPAFDSFAHPNAPFEYKSGTAVSAGQDAAAVALVEGTPYSFYTDSGGTLHANLGGVADLGLFDAISPDTVLEATPGLSTDNLNYDGIRVGQNAHKCYIHDILTEGYGCQSESSQNASGIRVGAGAECVVVILRCRSYYGGRHLISAESSDAVNGYGCALIKRGCRVGYYSLAGGAIADVAFSDKGKLEYMSDGTRIEFGPLPVQSGITSRYVANEQTRQGAIDPVGAFYAHSGGTGAAYSPCNIYINRSSRILDHRQTWPTATVAREGFLASDDLLSQTPFLVGEANNPDTYRFYVIDFHSTRMRSTTAPKSLIARSRTLFLNCRFYYNVAWSTASLQYIWQGGSSGYFANCLFEVDYEGTMALANTMALALFGQTTAVAIGPRFMGCDFVARAGNLAGYIALSQNNFNQASTWGLALGNCLFSSPDAIMNGYSGKASKWALGSGGFTVVNQPANSATYLRNIATYGALMTDESDGGAKSAGFGNASGLLNLETAGLYIPQMRHGPGDGSASGLDLDKKIRSLGRTNPLAGRGSRDPFGDSLTARAMSKACEFDINGDPRPYIYAIGAGDVNSPIRPSAVRAGNAWRRLFFLGG